MIIDDTPLAPQVAPLRARRLPWWGALLIAVCVAFVVACLGAAAPSLQRPAGPVLCRDGTFVPGNHSQPTSDGEGTGYDIDSSCVTTATGQIARVDSFAIVGVLWAEYTVVAFVVLMVLLALVRAVRGTLRADGTLGGQPSGVTVV